MINNASKLRPTQKLRIRLISGHHLPKSASKKIKGNVIQPYISVKLRGHVLDEAEFTTEVVPKVNFERNLLWTTKIFSLSFYRTDSIQFGKVALNFTWYIPNLHSWNFKYAQVCSKTVNLLMIPWSAKVFCLTHCCVRDTDTYF